MFSTACAGWYIELVPQDFMRDASGTILWFVYYIYIIILFGESANVQLVCPIVLV